MSNNDLPSRAIWVLEQHGCIDDWVKLYTKGIENCKSKKEISDLLKENDLGTISIFMRHGKEMCIDSIADTIFYDFEKVNNIEKCSPVVQDLIDIQASDWVKLAKKVYDGVREEVEKKLNKLEQNQNISPNQ